MYLLGCLFKIIFFPLVLTYWIIKWAVVGIFYFFTIIISILLSILGIREYRGRTYRFKGSKEELKRIDNMNGIEFEHSYCSFIKRIGIF